MTTASSGATAASRSPRRARLDERHRQITASVIWQLLGRQRRWLGALLLLAVGSFSVAISVAIEIRDAVDLAMVEQTQALGPHIDALVGLALLGLLVGLPLRQVVARLGYHLEYELRIWVYDRLHAMHPSVLDALASGQAMTRAMSDLTMLELAALLVPAVAVGVVLLIALAVVIVLQDPMLGLLALASVPLNLWFVLRIRKPLFGLSWTILNRRAEVTTAIDEAVRGARVVKAFAREDDERARVRGAAAAAYGATLNRVRLTARFELLLRAVPLLVDALILVLGAQRVVDGRFSIGQLLIFLIFTGVFTGLARSFEEIVSVWQLARSGARRIFELLDLAPAAPPPPPPPAPGEPLVARGAELEVVVEPGELVVLDGSLPPGGLEGPGVLVLDDQPFFFGTSVAANLRMADPEASDADLHRALDAAALGDVIEELGGLSAALGDRGLTLSGGQRQRLALARALLSPARVLVLHDGLAAVNPALELEIVRRVRAAFPGLAVITVSTRPLIAAEADRTIPTGAVGSDPDDPARTLLAALATARPEQLLPPELLEALASMPPERDQPALDDTVATDDREPPGVRNLLRPFAGTAVAAGGLLLLITVVGLVPPGLIRLAIDDLRDGTAAAAGPVALGIAACGVAVGLLTYVYKITAARVSEGIMYLLRRRTFQRLTRLGVDYYDRELPGRVAARVVHDLDRIAAFVETGIYQAATAAIVLTATVAVMALWSAEVALVVLVALPVLALVTAIEVPLANRAYRRAREELGVVIARLQEDLAGRYVISSLGAHDQARERFAAAAWDLRCARRRSTTISNVHGEVVQAVVSLATAGVLATAGRLTVEGQASIGAAIMLQLYLVLALAPIPQLSAVLQSYLAARASFRTLGEPFRAAVLPATDRPAVGPCPPLRGELGFDAVSFAYPGTSRPVVRDIDLRVEPGELVAVVGPTGAGKSTLAKLLGRVYDPVTGTVSVDGTDIRSHELGSYRRRLGVVPQDGFCFRGTLAANLAYGRPDADRTELLEVARVVGAEAVIEAVPGGLDGLVDEEGRNLLAAHRQLVAIARAWLLDPDVLVLDEATAALGLDTESRLLDAVVERARTTLFVTHRSSVAARTDRVVVVDRGGIVATGPHDTLLEEAWYRALWPTGDGSDRDEIGPLRPGVADPLLEAT